MPLKNYMAETTSWFIFQNIISRFGCPKSLTSDRGTHFINDTIKSLLESIMIQHHKIISYHPQANGTVVSFKKILEKALKRICNAQRDD